MAGDSSGNLELDELNYREIQSKLKHLGLPAKGADKVLRERLAEALAEGKITVQQIEGAKSPPSSPSVPHSPRRRKAAQGEKSPNKSPKRERFVITTEVKGGRDSKRQSQQILSATKAALPEANIKVKRVLKAQSPETPLDRIKRLATDSASKLQKSASRVQRRIRKQKVGRWWPAAAVALLFLALLVGGISLSARHGSAAWQRQISRQLEGVQGSLETLYQSSQQQAAWLGNNMYQGYGYVQDSVTSGTSRLSKGASQAWDASALYIDDTYDKALRYLPALKKFRAALPTSACSARVDGKLLNGLLPSSPAWDGLKVSLQDAWHGLKDDPLKGTGILLAGKDHAALEKAAAVIEAAVPPDCKACFLHLKGSELVNGGNHAAGELQLRLFHHLEKCPNAIIHIDNLTDVHADLLTVFLSVLSEQGGLTVNGKTIPAYRALYIGTVVAPPAVLSLNDEQHFNAAVKRDLVFQFEMGGGPTQAFTAEVFRRRWDYTAPLR